MTEPRLADALFRRFSKVMGRTLIGYVVVVTIVFGVVGELGLQRSMTHSADLIESLLALYADPEETDATVATAMIVDQLLGMGDPYIITKVANTTDGRRSTYLLSPTMPAKLLEGLPPNATVEEIRAFLLDAITQRQRWRYRVLHRPAGAYDIFVASSRLPYLIALLVVTLAGLLLLPVAWWVSRRSARVAVAQTLLPLERASRETVAIGPADLGRGLESPTGQAEVTVLVDGVNRMLDRVERAHRSLEAFTADASHELRTPLTHLKAQAQWALDESRSIEDVREAVAAIVREVEHTNRLAEDMLLIARGENQQLAVDRVSFDACVVVRDVEEIATAMAADRDITIGNTLDGPVWVTGDAGRTRQILLNLASNAVRNTTAGTITFGVERDGSEVGLMVRDTGVGIADEHHQRIFDRFYRADQARSREHGGTGLGLTIARLLARLQSGRLSMSSSPGAGSTFILWLPEDPRDEEVH
jgi:signal transduction histidine kinase